MVETPPQILVAQLGARMHYAVPALLHRAGMLAHFYTDAYAGRGSVLHLLPEADFLIPARWRPIWRQFLSRQEAGLPWDKVTAFNLFGWRCFRATRRAVGLAELEQAYLTYGEKFGHLVRRRNFRGVDGIYAFPSACRPLFQRAAELGIYRILEQFIAPKVIEWEILSAEARLWPGWERPYPGRQTWQPRMELEQEEWALADTVLCPSDFVAQGLAALGVPEEKIRIVPYGIETARFSPKPSPWDGRRPLRVLFVGGVTLRKGPQYLWRALEMLQTTKIEARLVGGVAILEPYRQMLARRLELRGRVPRGEVSRHLHWADVFVLPSLCEGSATAIYEAMAAGLPVITTPNAGSVVRDGVDGFIVPIRDPEAVAARLDTLAGDRQLHAGMAAGARERMQNFSWENYQARLVTIIRERLGPAQGRE